MLPIHVLEVRLDKAGRSSARIELGSRMLLIYVLRMSVFLLVILSLPLFKKIEKMYFPASRIKTVNLVYSDDNADIEAVKKALASCGILLRDINYSTDFADDKFKVEIIVNTPSNVDFVALGKKLKKTGDLSKLSFQ